MLTSRSCASFSSQRYPVACCGNVNDLGLFPVRLQLYPQVSTVIAPRIALALLEVYVS